MIKYNLLEFFDMNLIKILKFDYITVSFHIFIYLFCTLLIIIDIVKKI
jgi:hypothetical protein